VSGLENVLAPSLFASLITFTYSKNGKQYTPGVNPFSTANLIRYSPPEYQICGGESNPSNSLERLLTFF